MSLDNATIENIARLARLELSADDTEHYRRELSRILKLVEQMDACDTGGVTPMTHPNDDALRLRDDQVTEHDQRDKFQHIAPLVEQGLYLVPRVVE